MFGSIDHSDPIEKRPPNSSENRFSIASKVHRAAKMMTESGNIFAPSKPGDVTSNENGSGTSEQRPSFLLKSSDGLGTLGTKVCENANLAQMTAKIDELKTWTVSKYKTTKQDMLERLGKVERTHDKEIEDKIESLRDTHRRYNELLSAAKAFASYFALETNMQKVMAESFYQLSVKEESLKPELNTQCDFLRTIAHNGEAFHKALAYMISSLETLCEKTIEDTMLTIYNQEQARLEYDVVRQELMTMKQNPNALAPAVTESEEKCNLQRVKYEHLKEDVRVKIALLDENRLKVMRKQMSLFHAAMTAYYSGNLKTLQSTIEQFSLDENNGIAMAKSSTSRPNVAKNSPSVPSFLEQ